MNFSSVSKPNASPGAGKTVFVTVGTTEFDSLIRTIDDPSMYDLLACAGFTRLVIQMGRGQYEPLHRANAPSSLAIDVYRFKPSITADIASADLVIGHAGAGTTLEVLAFIRTLNSNFLSRVYFELRVVGSSVFPDVNLFLSSAH